MKLVAWLVLGVSVLVADGADFMGHRKDSTKQSLAQDVTNAHRDMPETQHKKEAGNGYKKGSPLYDKQQKRKDKKPPPPPGVGIPSKLEAPDAKLKAPDKEDVVPNSKEDFQKRSDYGHFVFEKLTGFEILLYRWLPHSLLVLLFAVLYTKFTFLFGGRHPEGYGERDAKPDDFSWGLFSGEHLMREHHPHWHICFCTICCSPIRLADTWSKNPDPLLKNFWAAFIIVIMMNGLHMFAIGWSLAMEIAVGFLLVCICVYFRQKMRTKYGIISGGKTFCWDFLYWCCCPCCTMIQEARQVEFVMPPSGGVDKARPPSMAGTGTMAGAGPASQMAGSQRTFGGGTTSQPPGMMPGSMQSQGMPGTQFQMAGSQQQFAGSQQQFR